METLQYYVRRLLPFFLVYYAYEAVEAGALILQGTGVGGFHSAPLLGLLNETTISFIFCALPYMLYLLALPGEFHGGRHDRAVTLGIFILFCVTNALDELTEVLSGNQFNLLASSLFLHPKETLSTLISLPGAALGIFAALAIVCASILFFREKLVSPAAPPNACMRLAVPFALSSLAFILLQAQEGLVISSQKPVLYSDGLFTLFGGIFAFTAIPDLSRIYAQPCIWLAAAALTLLLFNTAIRLYSRNQTPPLARLQSTWTNLCSRYGKLKIALFCTLAAVMLVRLASLGLYPLMDTTEARYGEMARKMIETGNWLQPQFDYGVPFWGKPPLSFQASAITMKLFGINAFAARLAPFLATSAIGMLFYFHPFGRERIERSTAACIIFFTSAIGFVAAGAVMTDAFLTLGVTLAMISFQRAMYAPEPANRWGFLFFVGLAIGLLSKGPLILPLCGMPILLWTFIFRRQRELWQKIPWIKGTILLTLLAVPWYIAAERATPGFLRYFLIGEHFERFVVKGWQGDLYGSGHSRAIGTIWLYAVEMFLPWTLLIPFLLRRPSTCTGTDKGQRVFLWLWGLSPLLFFTAARNILPAYVLPGIPAFCILLADTLWERQKSRPGIRQFIFLPIPLLLLVSLFALGEGFKHIEYRCDRDMLQAWDGSSPLYYADNKATYSGQFYSGGKARPLKQKPEELPAGSCIAAREDDEPLASTLAESPEWKLLSSNRKWLLFKKTKALKKRSLSPQTPAS